MMILAALPKKTLQTLTFSKTSPLDFLPVPRFLSAVRVTFISSVKIIGPSPITRRETEAVAGCRN
jgi:hypothetical protein